MNRRTLLYHSSSVFTAVTAGCNGYLSENEQPPMDVDIRSIEVTPNDSRWALGCTLEIAPVTQSVPDMTLVAYTYDGELVCEKSLGDFSGGRQQLQCTSFPEIISARTSLDCHEINIDIVYWTGTDNQQAREIPDNITDNDSIYQLTQRECGESLPPERLLAET